MKECDNSKIHISSNFLLFVCLLIMLDTFITRTITALQHFVTLLSALAVKATSVEHEDPHSQEAFSCDTQTFSSGCSLSCFATPSVSTISITDDNDSHLQTRWQNCEKWLLASSYIYVCLSESVSPHGKTTRLLLDGIVWNFILEYFSKICRENSSFTNKRTRISGTLHEDKYTFLITSLSVLLRMRNVSDKSCREN
jgi:hypothetical protein